MSEKNECETSIEEYKARRQRWYDALLSGKYKQGKYYLRNENDEFCCFGVACEIFEKELKLQRSYDYENEAYAYNDDCELLPVKVVDFLGLLDEEGNTNDYTSTFDKSLVSLNDSGKSFAEIVEILKNNEDKYYKCK